MNSKYSICNEQHSFHTELFDSKAIIYDCIHKKIRKCP